MSFILVASLVLASGMALASCGGSKTAIYEKAASSSPTKTVTIVDYVTAAGEQLTAAAAVSFNLDESKMMYSISAGTLTVNIKAADTAAVLGASTGADTVLTISIANGAVAGATITYVTAYGPATIACTYNK